MARNILSIVKKNAFAWPLEEMTIRYKETKTSQILGHHPFGEPYSGIREIYVHLINGITQM